MGDAVYHCAECGKPQMVKPGESAELRRGHGCSARLTQQTKDEIEKWLQHINQPYDPWVIEHSGQRPALPRGPPKERLISTPSKKTMFPAPIRRGRHRAGECSPVSDTWSKKLNLELQDGCHILLNSWFLPESPNGRLSDIQHCHCQDDTRAYVHAYLVKGWPEFIGRTVFNLAHDEAEAVAKTYIGSWGLMDRRDKWAGGVEDDVRQAAGRLRNRILRYCIKSGDTFVIPAHRLERISRGRTSNPTRPSDDQKKTNILKRWWRRLNLYVKERTNYQRLHPAVGDRYCSSGFQVEVADENHTQSTQLGRSR